MKPAKKATSRIDELGVRDLVENLFEARTQYPEIIAAVKEVTGEAISDSALSRAYIKWQSDKRHVEEAAKRIDALVRQITGREDGAGGEAGLQLLKQAATERFARAMQDFEDADILELGWLFNESVKTQQKAEALRLQRERLDLQKAKVAEAADKVDAVAKAGGLSEETRNRIREEIYGLAPASEKAA